MYSGKMKMHNERFNRLLCVNLALIAAVVIITPARVEGTLREMLRERMQKKAGKRGDLVTAEDYEEINTGLDFTRPLARTEIRYKYMKVTGGIESSFLTFRYDTPYRLENGWTFFPRLDVPFVYNDAPSRDNPNGDYEFGFGDLSAQFLLIRPPRERWTFVSGAQLIWPTAGQDQMGFGKYILAPTIGAVYHPESWEQGDFAGFLIRDLFDYAGKDERKDIHELSIQPLINYNLKDSWFVTLAPDIRVNWEDNNNVFLPFHISIGKLVSDDKVITVGFSSPIVNDYDLYDWQIEIGVSYFF
jgi:hypothetical protein